MMKKDKNLSVLEIRKAMGEFDSKYNDNNPEDANEFISDYLNALRKETGIKDKNLINEIGADENYTNFLKKFYKKGTSFITDLFFGTLRTENFCINKCNETFSVKYNSFSILDLPLHYLAKNKKKSLEIEDIIERFVREKEISDMSCKQCGGKFYIKTDIYKFPYNLIIYLERKDDNYYIENDINIKTTIDLSNFLYKEKTEKACYNLKGVIYYSFLGNNLSHYSASCLIGNEWYYFDDEYYESNKEYVEYEGDNPILLFYEKNK
jgi:ubiquitin C-terminal hydrolase